MNIRKIESKLIILVRFEEIPILELLQTEATTKFRDFFGFTGGETFQSGDQRPSIQFVLGKANVEDEEINITNVKIEDRRILILVEGNSEDADKVWVQLRTYFARMAQVEDDTYLDPLLIARESVIITKMDITIEDLVNPMYLKFVNEDVVGAAKSDLANAWSQLNLLTFNISYEPVDSKHLEQVRIGLSRKEFSISPRTGYPLSEKVFFSSGPFDTDTHIKLLEKFEKSVK